MKEGIKKSRTAPGKKARKKERALTREAKLFLVAFGNRVRELREKEGMSQDQLAYECDMDRTTILRIEKGHYETGITSIAVIAKALGIETAELTNFKTG